MFMAALGVSALAQAQSAEGPIDPWLFGSSFESGGGSIEFVSDEVALFTAPGQSHEFEVRVLDADGHEVPNAVVRWELSDPSGLSLQSIAPGKARITAEEFQIGSRMLRVSTMGSGTAIRGQVLFARLQPDARAISSDMVISLERDPVTRIVTVTLTRDEETEVLQAGQVILTGSLTGLLDEILTVNVGADTVVLTAQPSSLLQAFAELEQSFVSEPMSLPGLADVATIPAGLAAASAEDICELDGEAIPFEDISGQLPDPTLSSRLYVALEISLVPAQVTFAYIGVNIEGQLIQPPWQIELGVALNGTLKCSIDLPKFVSPAVKVYGFPIRLGFQPSVGINGSIGVSGQVTLQGPSGVITGSSQQAILYSNSTWAGVGVSNWVATGESSFELPDNLNTVVSVGVVPAVSVDTELILGGSPIGIPSPSSPSWFEFAFLNMQLGLPSTISLQLPLQPDQWDYTGPQWQVDATVGASLKAELSGGVAVEAFEQAGIPKAFDGELELFGPVVLNHAESPKVILIADCPSPCLTDPGTLVNITGWGVPVEGPATLTLVQADGEDVVVQELGSQELVDGKAQFQAAPAEDGRDRFIFPRLASDELSKVLPYALTTTPVQISTSGGVMIPGVHEVSTDAVAQVFFGSPSLCENTDGDYQRDSKLPVVGFAGTIDLQSQASASLPQGLSSSAQIDLQSTYMDTGADIVMTADMSTTTLAVKADDVICISSAGGSAEGRLDRTFMVTVPVTYNIEAACMAGLSEYSTVQLLVDNVPLYELSCGEEDVGSPQGNGVIYPGATTRMSVYTASGAGVGSTGFLTPADMEEVTTSANATLTLAPQNP